MVFTKQLLCFILLAKLSTTEICPLNFTNINEKCLMYNKTACPYPGPLPLSELKEFSLKSNQIRVNLNKSTKMGDYGDSIPFFFKWTETPGLYGETLMINTSFNDSDQFASYNFDEETFLFQSEEPEDDFACVFNNLSVAEPNSFCRLFDEVCSNQLKRYELLQFNTTNCHCILPEINHYCLFSCNGTQPKWSEHCSICVDLYKTYHNPQVSLYYNMYANKIDVGVSAHEKVYHYKEKPLIYCYTNANHSEFDITYRYDFVKDYNTTNRFYTIEPIQNRIGHYWCVGFKFNNNSSKLETIYSPRIIAQNYDNNTTEEEQAFTIRITPLESIVNYEIHQLSIQEDLEQELYSVLVECNVTSVNFLRFLNVSLNPNETLLAYRCTTNSTSDLNTMFNELQEIIEKNLEKSFEFHSILASYCLEDVTLLSNGRQLTWKPTLLGMRVLSEELCLQEDKTPVTRECLGEYLEGAFWTKVTAQCYNHSADNIKTTIALHSLRNSAESEEKIKTLQEILKNETDFLMVDAHFISEIVENLALNMSISVDLAEKLVQISSDFSSIEADILAQAQLLLNATDRILYSLDFALNRYNFSEQFTTIKSDNLYVQISRLDTNITGAGFYNCAETMAIQPIYSNSSVNTLEFNNLQLAAFFSDTELLQIRRLNLTTDQKLIVILFRQNTLFNTHRKYNNAGDIIGFYISNFHERFLFDGVKIILKPDRLYHAKILCNHWNYGRNQLWKNEPGQWDYEGMDANLVQRFYWCKYSHMTHFGMLIGAEEDRVLNIITLIGCILSMCGSVAVISTACIHKTWREQSGTKILLNLVVCLIAQNIVLSVSSEVDGYKNENACIATGALLHYFVGSQFSWMLIVGYLQYERYVRVFFTVNDRFVLKISIAAWGLPLMPVAIMLVVDKQDYIQENYCYLIDESLYYAVFLPVSLVILMNIVIFGAIFHSLNRIKNDMYGLKQGAAKLQLRLAIVLFFLFGFYWIFGISSSLVKSLALNYLFSISASFQGVVLFVYYVVFNKMTRNFWKRQLQLERIATIAKGWLQNRNSMGRLITTNTNYYKIMDE